jgi:alkanesulfonate monooxygenase SsuD/methylene tetrahydromethanopterin reductase-like flavin-dependent oxidoreductase (luciferase family)
MLSRTQPRTKSTPEALLGDLQHPIIDAYLAALPAGREPRIMASRTLFVADDRKEALRLADIGLSRVVDHLVEIGSVAPGRPLSELMAALDMHVGTPDDVIASLRADSTLARATDLVFQVHSVDPPMPISFARLSSSRKPSRRRSAGNRREQGRGAGSRLRADWAA